jgi:alpha-tubulin suppressor-like RCC1 family protein
LALALCITTVLAATPQVSEADDAHSVALKADGSMWAWGDNEAGQLGDGTLTERHAPVLIGYNYAFVAAGVLASYGIKTDGTLWAWGDNSHGQLGDGTTINRTSPVEIGDGFQSVATTWGSTVGLKRDGTLWSWGQNTNGVLGNGTLGDNIIQPSPKQIGVGFSAIAAGNGHVLALKPDGSLWAWGNNSDGQIGTGDLNTIDYAAPTYIGAGYISIAAGEYFSLALKPDGTLWGWGTNARGQLGQGSTTTLSYSRPTRIPGSNYSAIATDSFHVTALKTDGSLWTWGSGPYGALGDGSTGQVNSPEQIGTGYWKLSSGGGNNVGFALRLDGSLWAWGNNYKGDLGDGTITDHYVPIATGFSVYPNSGLVAEVSASGPLTAQTVQATVAPNSGDAGKQGYIFVAAVVPGDTNIYLLSGTNWTVYEPSNPVPYSNGTLKAIDVPVVSAINLSSLVGTNVLLGYGTGGTALQALTDMLKRGLVSSAYTVH